MKQTSTNYLLFGILLVIAAVSIQNIKWIEFFNVIGLHALTTLVGFATSLVFIIDVLSVVSFIAGIIIGWYGFSKKDA